jgi:hypothetical protein
MFLQRSFCQSVLMPPLPTLPLSFDFDSLHISTFFLCPAKGSYYQVVSTRISKISANYGDKAMRAASQREMHDAKLSDHQGGQSRPRKVHNAIYKGNHATRPGWRGPATPIEVKSHSGPSTERPSHWPVQMLPDSHY